jgi:hypothetical protein
MPELYYSPDTAKPKQKGNNHMKVRSILVSAIVVILTAQAVRAATYWDERFRYERGGDKFGPQEFRIDLFGSAATRNRIGDSQLTGGGGAGVNFFLTPIFGIGADTYIEDWKWPDHTDGSLFLRWPIQSAGIAPYVFGGGGRQWHDIPQWTKHAGGGLELRFNRYTGIFADGRYIWPEETRDYVLMRAGLRIGF